MLYGGKGVEWDFGVHLEALMSFWKDRSQLARASVKHIRIAKQIPREEKRDGKLSRIVDAKWDLFCAFLRDELLGLKTLDLTIWTSSGLIWDLPSAVLELSPTGTMEDEDTRRDLQLQQWKEWYWTRDLLQSISLGKARITWWGFQNVRDESNFDSWLAGRMVSDKIVKERMIREGLVIEGVTVLPGRGV